MKKVILFSALFVCGLVLFSCSKKANTPSAVVEKALKCIQEKDFEGYLDLVYFKDAQKDPAKLKEEKAQLLSLLESKMPQALDKNGGIKEYKITEETIEEDKAVVKYHLVWGNGEEKDDDMVLVKTEEGEWMLNSGK